MYIGIASLIAPALFSEFLYPEYKEIANKLNNSIAPSVTTLAIEFLKNGHNVVIFTQDSCANKLHILRGERLIMHIAPANKKYSSMLHPFLSTYVSIHKLFKMYDGPLDVISAHWTRDYAMAAKYFIGKIPVFVTVRDILPYIIRQQPWKNKLGWGIIYLKNEWVMRQKGFNYIANSEYTARMVKKYWDKTIPVIPNSISDTFLTLSDKQPDDKFFTITTISISPPYDKRKNIITLLKAFNILSEKHPHFRLNLVGRGFTEDNPEIIQLRSEGLLTNVKLCGGIPHPQVIDLLQNSNLMVHPSLEETFGNTLLEAMACGCPVLGGKWSGAVPDVLDNGNAGYLCDVSDINSIVSSVEHIYSNPKEVSDKISYAKSFCADRYSSKSIADAYINLFLKVKDYHINEKIRKPEHK